MSALAHADASSPAPGAPAAEGMVWIPGGTFRMGSDHHYPEEAPAHNVTVGGFRMDRYAVTNAEFKRFVEATGYVTLAEGLIHAESGYPVSFTLIVALLLLAIGVLAIVSMVFSVGPFD